MNDQEKLSQIAESLCARTQAGSVTWNETADPDKFVTSLEDYSIAIEAESEYKISLQLVNSKGRPIAAMEAFRAQTPPKSTTWKTFSDLYEMARRQALKIDQALDDVLNRVKITA